MEYDNELTGALFANRDRKTDKHPNARGTATIDGVEYWVSAWTNTSQKGEKYQSLKFQRKDDTQSGAGNAQSGAGNAPPDDGLAEDIPFNRVAA